MTKLSVNAFKGGIKGLLQDGIRRIRGFAYGPPPEHPRPPRIGVALGGGFARGISHLGVLRVLEAEGIPVDCLSGTSVGGLIAAAYASGATVDAISKRALSTSFRDFARWSLSRFGLASNERMGRYVHEFCGVERIEQMKKPLAICAVDLLSGEPYYFTKGDLGLALRASCAYPGLFQPVEFEGRLLVDGFLVGPVPVEAENAGCGMCDRRLPGNRGACAAAEAHGRSLVARVCHHARAGHAEAGSRRRRADFAGCEGLRLGRFLAHRRNDCGGRSRGARGTAADPGDSRAVGGGACPRVQRGAAGLNSKDYRRIARLRESASRV
ncbi:MAG TPA: patatin-like phospholipase family protein [Candidatus Acidoferrales bacterium]|nr:patatin-like phospholipase family protein [Candidatus Acidoferrales bacterium]